MSPLNATERLVPTANSHANANTIAAITDRAAQRARPAGHLTLPGAAALAVIVLINVWFWVVSAHRIHGEPFAGFAYVFVTGCGDFEHFYHAGRAMLLGQDIYASGAGGYIYPPLVAFLFMPLAWLPVKTAALVMLAINIALGVWCTWLASAEALRRFNVEGSFNNVVVVAAVTLFLAATKMRSEFQMWQTNVPMMLAVLLAFRWLDARPRLAGLLLGAAVNVKYLPIVLLPYLILRRRYKAAAAFVVGIVVFALLPALRTGLATNLRQWKIALSGLARLLGMDVPVVERAANVDPIAIGHSISITSGLSRVLGPQAPPNQALLLAGAVALVLAVLWVAIYARSGKPLLRWPEAARQRVQPYLGMVALEWAGLIALVLAFSPQTNPRHTSLLLMVFAPIAVMLCFPRTGQSRSMAWWAMAILFVGIVLPPNLPQFAELLTWWRRVGAAGWSMALMLPFFLMAGLRYVDGSRPATLHVH